MKLKKEREKINPKQMLDDKRSHADELQDELELKGVRFFHPDNGGLNIDTDFLNLPRNITEVSARDIGEYLNAFTQQKMYVRTLIGWAECMVDESQLTYNKVSSDKYKELSKTKLSETAKEKEVNSDVEIIPAYENLMDMKRKLQMLKLNLSSIEDAIFLISREVSRRTGDFNDERRNSSVNK